MFQQQIQHPPPPFHQMQPGMQQMHMQQMHQPSQHYGDYGQVMQSNAFSTNAWQAFGFQNPDELQSLYNMAVNSNPQNQQRQAIQSEELVKVMNESGRIRNFFGINWSRELCKIMVTMLDRSRDGFLQWPEFMELQQCLVQWKMTFDRYDVDRNRVANANELLTVISNMFKFKLTPESMTTLLKRYSYVDPSGQCVLAFDDFVTVCVKLRALTDAYRRRDSVQHNGMETGQCTFQYDDFLQCVMCL